ncbi:MAG: heme biosynthesis protein HemY [Zoogloeaceae bacterium]|jgi:HemY protein|nr:heme biosynthesis protein HemY [Zoogloeaceae bacterium]
MRSLLWFLGSCLLAVVIAIGVRYNNGLVLVVLPPWRVDFSLNFFIAALLLAWVFAYFLLRSILFSLGLPARARAYRAARQREDATRMLEDAIRLLFEGRYGQALRRAEGVWEKDHACGTAALIAARAAQRLREYEKVALWLERAGTFAPMEKFAEKPAEKSAEPAAKADPETRAAALMIGAESAVEQGEYERALLLLAELQRLHGRHIAALRLELRARQQTGDAEGVLKLVRQLEKRGGLPPEVARAIRAKAHTDAVRRQKDDAGALLDYYRHLRREEQSPRLALAVAENLHAQGEDDKAASLIEAALAEHEWLPELAALYGELDAADGSRTLLARIARADAWLEQHPEDSRLLLALGRICERQQLWGKAKRYLEASLALDPDRETCLALAHLLDRLGETEAANRYFRKAAETGARLPRKKPADGSPP